MRSTLFALLALSCATARQTPPAASTLPPPLRYDDPTRAAKIAAAAKALEPALLATLEKTRAPGAAIGLVVDGQLVWFKATGVREVASQAPVDEDTVFRIASMSKAFASASALRLRDEGKLVLDDPAEKYLPELRGLRYPTADSPRISVRHLLSHSAGLPEDNASADLRMPMSDAEFDELLSHGLSFSVAPGTQYEYANLGFALAGRLVSRVSGERVQEYIERHLLKPLGMTASGWDGAAIAPAHQAHGYGRKSSAMPAKGLSKYKDDDAPHEEPMLADGAWAAIGGLWTSPRDYAKWVAFQLSAWPPRDGPDDGPVRRSSLRETQSLQRFSGLNAARDAKGELRASAGGYGLGWGVSATCRFEQLIAHNGGLPGYGSRVVLLPDRGVGAFSMTNLTYTSGGKAVNDLLEALDQQGLIPKRPLPVSPQLEAARATVLSLLARYDVAEAMAAFDKRYAAYESFAALETRLAGLRSAHGECTAGAPFLPENALRGRARLACERGALELTVTLTSDSPPRIQSLALESALPPSPRLSALGGRAAELLARWDDGNARDLFPKSDEREEARGRFAAAARDHGACSAPVPFTGDGLTTAAFKLSCDHGDLVLSLELTNGEVTKAELSSAPGGPRCPP
jgi:D-alanyl-D-alanine-carboxypeptidase/D-alanyl-D-alanine-endopeptidase